MLEEKWTALTIINEDGHTLTIQQSDFDTFIVGIAIDGCEFLFKKEDCIQLAEAILTFHDRTK